MFFHFLSCLWTFPPGFPTLKELQIKSGRSRTDVIAGLRVLEQERYIELDENGQIRNLLEAWERPAFRL